MVLSGLLVFYKMYMKDFLQNDFTRRETDHHLFKKETVKTVQKVMDYN